MKKIIINAVQQGVIKMKANIKRISFRGVLMTIIEDIVKMLFYAKSIKE